MKIDFKRWLPWPWNGRPHHSTQMLSEQYRVANLQTRVFELVDRNQLLAAENARLGLALKRRDEFMTELCELAGRYDQTLAAEGKKEPAAGPAETSI